MDIGGDGPADGEGISAGLFLANTPLKAERETGGSSTPNVMRKRLGQHVPIQLIS